VSGSWAVLTAARSLAARAAGDKERSIQGGAIASTLRRREGNVIPTASGWLLWASAMAATRASASLSLELRGMLLASASICFGEGGGGDRTGARKWDSKGDVGGYSVPVDSTR